jgi:hypothetical protein
MLPSSISTAKSTRPGGVHESGTRRASTAYPAKKGAFLRVNRIHAPVTVGAFRSVEPHVPGSSAS